MPSDDCSLLSHNGNTPLVLLTGFLGAGKTQRLAAYLKKPGVAPTAVIVNEYGTEQIDGDLITHAGDGTIVETTTGCMCCSISGDVRGAVLALKSKAKAGLVPSFSRFIVETTGIADPVALVHALTHEDDLRQACHLDRVICVVDALRSEHWFERYEECRRQIAVADIIMISKVDLIEDPISRRELDHFIDRLRAFNPLALVVSDDTQNLADMIAMDLSALPDAGDKGAGFPARHGHGPTTVSLRFDEPVDASDLAQQLEHLTRRCGENLLRWKGVVAVKADGAKGLVVQGVGAELSISAIPDAPQTSRLVFIAEAVTPTEIAAFFARFRPRLEEAVHEHA